MNNYITIQNCSAVNITSSPSSVKTNGDKSHQSLSTRCSNCQKSYNDVKCCQKHLKQCKQQQVESLKPKAVFLKCPLCQEKYSEYTALMQHGKKMHPHILFNGIQCSKCKKFFQTENDLLQHNLAEHSENPTTSRCSMCRKPYNDVKRYRKHLERCKQRQVESLKPKAVFLKCPLCKEKYSEYTALMQHAKEKHPHVVFNGIKCEKCEKFFLTENDLLQHKLDEHPENPTTSSFAASNRELLLQAKLTLTQIGEKKTDCQPKELASTDESRIRRCRHCSTVLEVSDSLQRHELQCPSLKSANNKCTLCNIQYPNHSMLINHMTLSHINDIKDEKLNKCYHCDLSFRSEKLLEQHFTLIHRSKTSGEQTQIQLRCSACSLQVENLESLLKHNLLSHATANGKPGEGLNCFYCYMCSRKCNSFSIFVQHAKKEHSKQIEKTWFKCLFCGDLFFTEPEYDSHIYEKHRSEKVKFRCDFCLEDFHSKEILSKHSWNIHGQLKSNSFECEICKKKCNTYSLRNQHYCKSHVDHVQKHWFGCFYCDHFLPSITEMEIHFKNHHQGQGNNLSKSVFPPFILRGNEGNQDSVILTEENIDVLFPPTESLEFVNTSHVFQFEDFLMKPNLL